MLKLVFAVSAFALAGRRRAVSCAGSHFVDIRDICRH